MVRSTEFFMMCLWTCCAFKKNRASYTLSFEEPKKLNHYRMRFQLKFAKQAYYYV